MLASLGSVLSSSVSPRRTQPTISVSRRQAEYGVWQGDEIRVSYLIPPEYEQAMVQRNLWIGCYRVGAEGLSRTTAMTEFRCCEVDGMIRVSTSSLEPNASYVFALKEGEVWPLITTYGVTNTVLILPRALAPSAASPVMTQSAPHHDVIGRKRAASAAAIPQEPPVPSAPEAAPVAAVAAVNAGDVAARQAVVDLANKLLLEQTLKDEQRRATATATKPAATVERASRATPARKSGSLRGASYAASESESSSGNEATVDAPDERATARAYSPRASLRTSGDRPSAAATRAAISPRLEERTSRTSPSHVSEERAVRPASARRSIKTTTAAVADGDASGGEERQGRMSPLMRTDERAGARSIATSSARKSGGFKPTVTQSAESDTSAVSSESPPASSSLHERATVRLSTSPRSPRPVDAAEVAPTEAAPVPHGRVSPSLKTEDRTIGRTAVSPRKGGPSRTPLTQSLPDADALVGAEEPVAVRAQASPRSPHSTHTLPDSVAKRLQERRARSSSTATSTDKASESATTSSPEPDMRSLRALERSSSHNSMMPRVAPSAPEKATAVPTLERRKSFHDIEPNMRTSVVRKSKEELLEQRRAALAAAAASKDGAAPALTTEELRERRKSLQERLKRSQESDVKRDDGGGAESANGADAGEPVARAARASVRTTTARTSAAPASAGGAPRALRSSSRPQAPTASAEAEGVEAATAPTSAAPIAGAARAVRSSSRPRAPLAAADNETAE